MKREIDWSATPFTALGTDPATLSLAPSLLSGMSFRWRREETSGTFVGVLGSTIYELREETDGSVSFRAASPSSAKLEDPASLLRAHLRLDDGLTPSTHVPWLEGPVRQFRAAAAALPGVRVLRILDQLECLVTFIGSANNNIKRNMQMVAALCAVFEHNLLGLDPFGVPAYRFPSCEDLLTLSEADLWELGWGYRAPRIAKLTQQLHARGDETFLRSLPSAEDEARAALCELCGVGRKVADCILLFGYGFDGCVPVDTHCLQMAQRFLLPSIRGKPLTPPVYCSIVARFHEAFGADLAGWAFMTLFVAELSDFRRRLDGTEPPAPPKNFNPLTIRSLARKENALALEDAREEAPLPEAPLPASSTPVTGRSRRRLREGASSATPAPKRAARGAKTEDAGDGGGIGSGGGGGDRSGGDRGGGGSVVSRRAAPRTRGGPVRRSPRVAATTGVCPYFGA